MTTFKGSPVSGFSPRRRSVLLGGASTAALATLSFGGTAAAGEPGRSSAADFDFDTGNFIVDLINQFRPSQNVIAPMDVTVLHRFIHLITASWFDAAAPYHPVAVGVHTRLGRRPSSESATNRNVNIACLHASLQVIKGVEPGREPSFRQLMASVGLNPDDRSEDRTSPVGIGNLAGKGVVAARLHDGMNQLGDIGRRYNGKPYEDYTGYRPVNTAFEMTHPSRWQPKLGTHSRRLGGGAGDLGVFTAQHFVTPQLGRTKAYTFRDPKQFKLAAPRHIDHTRPLEYKRTVDEILNVSAGLTDKQKVVAEFFDNKFQGLAMAPLAAAKAHLRERDLHSWIHYGFTYSVALFDALIAVWYQKARYDAPRPFSAIRHVYGGNRVTAWGGPGKGTVHDIPADEWAGYLEVGDHPEYPSGSTTLCSAEAQAARRFFGDDTVDLTWSVAAGSTLVEPKMTPAHDLSVHWATWNEAVHDCGFSRVWGGVHFSKTIERSIEFGAQFGDLAYEYVQRYVKGEVKA